MSTSGRGIPPRYGLIDRDPQNLPLPVGGFDVIRQRHRASQTRKWLRLYVPRILITLGVFGALFGAYLTMTQPPTPVFLENNQIHIAGNILSAQAGSSPDQELFMGNGAMVLHEHQDGTATAGGSTVLGGVVVKGACTLTSTPAALSDNCNFTLGGTTVNSLDTYDLTRDGDHTWHRQYSDGRSTLISVPTDGAVVPVPFPVGR